MTYDCRSILKHVLKCRDNRKSCHRPVVCLSHATKIALCKSALSLIQVPRSKKMYSHFYLNEVETINLGLNPVSR